MDGKKELKEQYKQMKPDMGIFIIRNNNDKMCYIEATQNLKSKINSTKFQLDASTHRNKNLQNTWNSLGEDKFIIEVLENLKYNKDESKTDYAEELSILKLIWEDKLTKENYEFY